MAELVHVCKRSELPPGASRVVTHGYYRIGVFNLDGEYFALEDMCTHDGGPLVAGRIVNGCEVECPRHGARFDIRTGNALCMPAFMPTPTYEVRIDGDDIMVVAPE